MRRKAVNKLTDKACRFLDCRLSTIHSHFLKLKPYKLTHFIPAILHHGSSMQLNGNRKWTIHLSYTTNKIFIRLIRLKQFKDHLQR